MHNSVRLNILSWRNNQNFWHQFSAMLVKEGIAGHFLVDDKFNLLAIDAHPIILNLLYIDNQFNADELIALKNNYQAKNIKLIHLWEDVCISRPELVLARLKSLTGSNIKIHGRKTIVRKIDKPIADLFLSLNHLQGAVSARYKFGLFMHEELVAVATFSALRKMRCAENYKSAELIRFAVKTGYSINGGLSKLIASFRNQLKPNDLMTYADRDWSTGEAYIKLGFLNTDILVSQVFSLDKHYNRSLMTESKDLHQVFNTGSLKYILKFEDAKP